ncbi:MAG TPA: hypothetical protein VHR45_06830 [Thermoanaerobaculia bacterium]|nr:hypothetical protein [Thermoanaerobaculia bacterium]
MKTRRMSWLAGGSLGALPAAAALLGLPLLPALAGAQQGQPFVPGCTVPYSAIQKHQAIDDSCGIKGNAPDSEPAHQAQNAAKNNLCATGAPKAVTFAALASLQTEADNKLGTYDRDHLPADRSSLQQLGEGSVARIVAFVASAKYSGGTTGESVGCNLKGNANDDIHVVLMEAKGAVKGAQACPSVTAEVIPHLRPAAWTDKAIAGAGHPVRITGQLFFDASHHPCKNGQPEPSSPSRASEWEIHPVYSIEVCKGTTLAACPVDDDSQWSPLKVAAAKKPKPKPKPKPAAAPANPKP